MAPRSHSVPRLLSLALVAAVLAACTEQAPVAPEADDSGALDFSASVSALGAGPAAGEGVEWRYLDEHLVLFGGRGAPVRFDHEVAALGGSVLRVHPEINVAVVTGLTDQAAAKLTRSPRILAVPRDVGIKALPAPGEGAPEHVGDEGTAPTNHDQTTAFFYARQWNMRIIEADAAWDAGFNDASGVTVAILDSGLDPFHIDLAGRIDVANSVAFVPSFNPDGPVWGDDYFHGSHVGGTVTSNALGTAGVAPHATLVAVKVCGYLTGEFTDEDVGCPFSAIVGGLVHAASVGADVANLSLGGFISIPAAGGGQLNAILNRAVNFAESQGTLVVSAAGNNAVDLDHIERDFREFDIRAFRFTPCENGSGTCVSSTGPTDELASYSNFGRSAVNVAGPGGDFVVTANPLTSMVFAPCSSLTLLEDLAVCATSPAFFVFAQGTSMAAPHVSGAAALLDAQHGGGLNAGQLRTALQRSADAVGKRGSDPRFGKGRINVCSLVGC